MGRRSTRTLGAAVACALAGVLTLHAMPAAGADLGELSLKEVGGRFVVHRNGVPLDDERFLYLLEKKRTAYDFTYHARRVQDSTNLIHVGGTALGVWFSYLGYSLISRGLRLQAASYPDNPALTEASAANGRYDLTLGVQFALTTVACLATWLYQPRPFDPYGAQEVIQVYNDELRADRSPASSRPLMPPVSLQASGSLEIPPAGPDVSAP